MGSLLDSINIPTDSFSLNCRNKDEWKTGLKELNDTLENALEAVKNGNKTLEVIEEIKNRDVGVVSEEGQEVVDLVRDEDERLNRKKVTFYIDKVK